MADLFSTTLDLMAQFTGGLTEENYNIVRFVLAGIAWAALLALARQRLLRNRLHHERLLAWGFAFGLAREVFMLVIICLVRYGVVAEKTLLVGFPPAENALHDLAMVTIAAAFIGYLLQDEKLSRKYLQAGAGTVALAYLLSFWWWASFIRHNPGAEFDRTWCEWAFRVNASVLMGFAYLILLRQARGWQKNAVCTALALFFLFHFLKIIDISLAEVYEPILTPIRQALYLAAIPIFGYIYIREFMESEGQARAALATSEALYRALVENMDLGVTLIGTDFRIRMANAAQGRFIKKDLQELIGANCFRAFSRREEICPQCPGKAAMQSGSPQELVKESVRGDGSPITVRIRAFPVTDDEGGNQGFIEVVEDITERVKTEQELQRAKHLESIGVLAGGIAHDFNNILAAIFGFTDLARMKTGENSPIANELLQIRRASERARGLVQQILTLSRKKEHTLQPLRLSSLVKEALKLLRSTIPTSIDIEGNIASEALIMADPSQAHQLVMNLCTNAYHAMEQSGGTLSVTLQDIRLEEGALLGTDGKALPAGGYVQLQVRDTGTGIPEESLHKIFEPYFTTKEVGRGTGLGLAVVHGIVKSSGGAINVESRPHRGTTFTVTLPALEQPAPAEEQEGEEETPPGGSERIMVVDDEENICLLSFTFLSQAGYQVDTFVNGSDAWEAFSSTPDRWDLLITDQAMPYLTGTQLASRIRNIRPQLPVILCTGYTDTVHDEDIGALGISKFLQKPMLRTELLRVVHEVLHPGPTGKQPPP